MQLFPASLCDYNNRINSGSATGGPCGAHAEVYNEGGVFFNVSTKIEDKAADFLFIVLLYLHVSGGPALLSTYSWPGTHMKKHGSHYQTYVKGVHLVLAGQSAMARAIFWSWRRRGRVRRAIVRRRAAVGGSARGARGARA